LKAEHSECSLTARPQRTEVSISSSLIRDGVVASSEMKGGASASQNEQHGGSLSAFCDQVTCTTEAWALRKALLRSESGSPRASGAAVRSDFASVATTTTLAIAARSEVDKTCSWISWSNLSLAILDIAGMRTVRTISMAALLSPGAPLKSLRPTRSTAL